MIRLCESYEYDGLNSEFDLYKDCIDVFNNLYDLAYNRNFDDVKVKIEEMFEMLNGSVFVKCRGNSIEYDGRVESYTIGGTVYINDNKCFNRLIEDLTMAYYRNNGGVAPTTYAFINNLLKIMQED